MADKTKSDPELKTLFRDRWFLRYGVMDSGLVIRDVRHDGFNLAKDIRVTRVWIDTEYPVKSDRKHELDLKLNDGWNQFGLLATDDIKVRDSTTEKPVNPSSAFSHYTNKFELTASYRSNEAYLKDTPNHCILDVKQRYQFGNYGTNPAHEPTASLKATRLFPLLSFKFPPVEDKSQPYPKYFRADYRLDINLDNIDESELTKGSRSGDKTTNKAAIFRDRENPPGRMEAVSMGISSLFDALEKPLPREIVSWGLVATHPPSRISKQQTWDNVHIWPAKKGGLRGSISTPGAFHAFHCHWRWGAVAGDPDKKSSLAPAFGQPQFKGSGWSRSVGGALIDEAIPQQNLRFAITKNDLPEWAAEKNPSTRDFRSLFVDNRGRSPADLSNGDDLVLWISFEVFRNEDNLSSPWGGTLFVNGFYFAHNPDTTQFEFGAGGAYESGVYSENADPWERLAR